MATEDDAPAAEGERGAEGDYGATAFTPEAADEAVRAAGLGVYDFDLIAGTARWSGRALELFGGFDGPPTATQLRARVHSLDWPKLYAARQEAARHGALAERPPRQPPPPFPTDVLHRVIRPDGSVRWLRATGEYQYDEDGQVRRSVGVLRDVTREMEERARLADLAEGRRRALAAAGLGTFDFDARTQLVHWDELAKRAFGLPGDAPDARPLAEVIEKFHPDDREDVGAAVARALDPRGDGQFEASHRIVRPDGTIGRVASRATVEFADGFDGRYPVRTVGTIREVSDGAPARSAHVAAAP